MTNAWLLVTADDGALGAEVTWNGLDDPYLVNALGMLEDHIADRLHTVPHPVEEVLMWEGKEYAAPRQVLLISFDGIVGSFELYGSPLQLFHARGVAQVLRERLLGPLIHNACVAAFNTVATQQQKAAQEAAIRQAVLNGGRIA